MYFIVILKSIFILQRVFEKKNLTKFRKHFQKSTKALIMLENHWWCFQEKHSISDSLKNIFKENTSTKNTSSRNTIKRTLNY